MAENQLFPVFDLPEIPDNPEYDERYYPSVYFDFATGDFLLFLPTRSDRYLPRILVSDTRSLSRLPTPRILVGRSMFPV